MDALNFLKFWKPSFSTTTIEISNPIIEVEDENDSFFDLEFRSPAAGASTGGSSGHREVCFSPAEVFSKRKIIPIGSTSTSKPQSPISLLKSAPKFRVFMSKKSKSMAEKETKEPELIGENGVKNRGRKFQKLGSDDSNPNRFSKDVIQKYLKIIKPLYVKVSKKSGEKMKFTGELVTSAVSSPAMAHGFSSFKEKQSNPNFPAGIKVVGRNLVKSRSASSASGAASPAANRRDDSLLQQHDGIQSAILHCKRSFNSSRDCMIESDGNLINSARNSSEIGSRISI